MYKTGCIKDEGKRKILKKPSNYQRGAEFVPRAVVLSPVCTTLNNVHITVGMIMEWHVSISCTPF
jgi:hypothetical protein